MHEARRLLTFLLLAWSTASAVDSLRLCPLPDDFDFLRCGGHYTQYEDRDKFDSIFAYLAPDTLYACIDGELLGLACLKSMLKKGREGHPRVGDVVEELFATAPVTVKVTMTLTSICPTAEEPDCETIRFEGTLEVEAHETKRQYRIAGSFGC